MDSIQTSPLAAPAATTISFHWDGKSTTPPEAALSYTQTATAGSLTAADYVESWTGVGLTYGSNGSAYPTGGSLTGYSYALKNGNFSITVSNASYAIPAGASLTTLLSSMLTGAYTWTGQGANNVFPVYMGNPTYIGGAGVNALLFSGSSANYGLTLTAGQNGQTILNVKTLAGTDTITVSAIQRLNFSDASVAIDLDSANSAGGIFRLYEASFNRKPDMLGLGYWISKADAGESATAMATDFTYSSEFLALNGMTSMDPYASTGNVRNLVTSLYQNVLHRAPDPSGLDFYASQITGHNKTVGQVLAEIADSTENHVQVLGQIQNGITFTPWHG